MKDIEISKSTFILTIALVSVLAFSSGYLAFSPLMNVGHRDPSVSANVYILCETVRGTWTAESGNLITNIGERLTRNILGFDNVTANNATKWISMSNAGTPLVTWTELDTELAANGFTRALGTVVTWMNGTDYAYNVTKKFTATGTQQVQTAGLQWSGVAESDNNLFAAADFAQTTFESGDNCTITWVITWDAN